HTSFSRAFCFTGPGDGGQRGRQCRGGRASGKPGRSARRVSREGARHFDSVVAGAGNASERGNAESQAAADHPGNGRLSRTRVWQRYFDVSTAAAVTSGTDNAGV